MDCDQHRVIVKRTDQDEHQAEENSIVWTGRTPRHPDHREQQQAQAAGQWPEHLDSLTSPQ